MNKQTDFVLKKVVSLYMFLKIQSAKSTIQCHTNCTNCTHNNKCLTCVFQDCALKLHEELSNGAVEVAQPPSDFLEISQGRSFSYVQLKEMFLMETWKERRIERKKAWPHCILEIPFEDRLAWEGNQERRDALASMPVILLHHKHIPSAPPLPSLPPVFFSHLFLIKSCLP